MPQASDVPQVFVFPASNDVAQENLKKSMDKPVEREKVLESFDEVDETLRERLLKIEEDGEGFYAWGSRNHRHAPSRWRNMNRGDYVLGYYHKGYHYVARILDKFHNPTLATNIWGNDEKSGETWEYMYFLTKPPKIDRSASWVAELLGREEASLVYQGFVTMRGENRKAVLAAPGSVQGFVNRLVGHDGDGMPMDLLVPSGRSEAVAESSLETDLLAHGDSEGGHVSDVEGKKRIARHVRYERSQRNRARAVEMHGTKCRVCGFDFDAAYGHVHAASYVEIHHLKPLSSNEGKVDPATDLVPLCANCHRMAHRKGEVTPIDELKDLVRSHLAVPTMKPNGQKSP